MNHQRSSIFCFLSSGNVPLEPGKVFPLGKTFPWNRASFPRLGKRSPGTGQAFPAWENVPLEPGKLFPPGKTFLWKRASFSRLGKCSCGARQAFPAWENVPAERGKVSSLGKTFLRSAARFPCCFGPSLLLLREEDEPVLRLTLFCYGLIQFGWFDYFFSASLRQYFPPNRQ